MYMYVHLYVDVLWCLLQVPPSCRHPTRRHHAAPTPQCPVRPLCNSLYHRPVTHYRPVMHYRPTSPIADTVIIMTSARRLQLSRDIRALMIRPLCPLRTFHRRVRGALWVEAVPQSPPRTLVCIRACRTSSRKLIRPMTFRLQ